MSRFALRCVTLVGFAIASSASAAPILFDFGDSAQITGGNYNNIVVNPPGTLSIPNAVDTDGNGTGVGVSVAGFFNGSNTNGTTAPTGAAAIFDPQATRDNGFGHAAAFGTNPLTPVGTVTFTGLNPLVGYDFTFFGSRINVTDNRETLYTVNGAGLGSALLNTANNTALVAEVFNIVPTPAGEITVTIEPGPNNTSAGRFWYIGAMRVNAIPEPVSLSTVALAGLGLARRRR
jgi:hypothetical protein